MSWLKERVGALAGWAGGLLGQVTGSTELNKQQQYNFENQTQIRTKDALKAGINPLAALGMSGGYQPVFQNNTGGDLANIVDTVSSVAGGAYKGIKKLFLDQEKESRELSLENKKLENDYIRAQIDHLRNMNPGITGGAYTQGIRTDKNRGPSKTVPAEDWVEGEYPGTQILHTAGGDMYVPSKDAADSLDIEFGVLNPYAWEYFIRDLGGRIAKYNPARIYTSPKKYILDLMNIPYYNSREYRSKGGKKFQDFWK